jgi:hypothetical protein
MNKEQIIWIEYFKQELEIIKHLLLKFIEKLEK